MDNTRQNYTNTKILELQLDICSKKCASFESDEIDKMLLPECPLQKSIPGIYLRTTAAHFGAHDSYKVQNNREAYVWKPLGCKYSQRFESNDTDSCFENQHWSLFMGDSHCRGAFGQLAHRLHFERSQFVENPNLKEQPQRHIFSRSHSLRNSSQLNASHQAHSILEYAGRDGFLTWFTSKYAIDRDIVTHRINNFDVEMNQIDLILKDFDSLVLNSGSWEMLGIIRGGHFTASRFEAMLILCAETILEINRRRALLQKKDLQVIWLGIPATWQTETDVPYFWQTKDWRSPYRLKIWSDIAHKICSKYGFQIINLFDMSLPFVNKFHDGVHHIGTPVADATVDELLNSLNMCGHQAPKQIKSSVATDLIRQMYFAENPVYSAMFQTIHFTNILHACIAFAIVKLAIIKFHPTLDQTLKKKCPQWTIRRHHLESDSASQHAFACRNLESLNTTSFGVRLCESTSECGIGYFLVSRRSGNCDAFLARNISSNKDYDSWIKNALGPDSFWVSFQGPERASAKNWSHLGNCIYKLDFNVANTGVYDVSIMHTHENFEAVQEYDNTPQYYVNQFILKDFVMDVCSNQCKSFESAEIDQMDLPACETGTAVNGVYLRVNEQHALEQDLIKIRHNNNSYNRFVEDSKSKESPRFSVHFATNATSLNDSASNSVPHTRLEFAGRDGFLKWFASDYVLNPGVVSQTIAGREVEMNQIDLILRDFDSVVFNTGSWEMLGVRPYTTLRIWADVAQRVFSKFGFGSVDLHALSLPFVDSFHDGVHHIGTPGEQEHAQDATLHSAVADATADQLLNMLDICGAAHEKPADARAGSELIAQMYFHPAPHFAAAFTSMAGRK
ncbi:hypothetical protein HDU82_007634 [Entophlyctis luteolus]|nr:hypothetical protein HDU82_007634 [Entophlyctis luteolus]